MVDRRTYAFLMAMKLSTASVVFHHFQRHEVKKGLITAVEESVVDVRWPDGSEAVVACCTCPKSFVDTAIDFNIYHHDGHVAFAAAPGECAWLTHLRFLSFLSRTISLLLSLWLCLGGK